MGNTNEPVQFNDPKALPKYTYAVRLPVSPSEQQIHHS